jgi:hypothetical protein
MVPKGLLWNQADIGDDRSIHKVVASLIVIRPDTPLDLIGTAFLITAEDSRAIAVTASRCFEFIDQILNPPT